MLTLTAVVALLLGLCAGAVAGWFLGERARGMMGRYWTFNLVGIAVCMALDFVGLMQGIRWLSSGSLGLMAGLLAGLRFGFLDTVGKLKQPAPADTAAGEADRDAAVSAEAEPDGA